MASEIPEPVALQADALPWERRANESPEAYTAFAIYRDLGPERTLTMVARRVSKSRQLMSKWSTAHDWALRVRDFDLDVEQERRAAMLTERLESDRRHFEVGTYFMNAAERQLKEALERGEKIQPAYLAKLAETGSKLQRLALGEATSISESKSQRVESLTADLDAEAFTN